uniref:F-box domain-containing protein n=1 Tax=Caenorhabditis japonica TaxID=281687 RepID=A0A8R1HJ08_CAEJA
MLNEQIVRLLSMMHIHPSAGQTTSVVRRLKFGKKKSTPKFATLPESVWEIILDHLSPFERVKMRRVNQKLKNMVDNRRKRVLYADFLRTDVSSILPADSCEDGDFFRLPKSPRIVVHEEVRSILIIVDTHWTVSDAVKMMAAIRYYGANAHTVTLDASLAELCVAAQCTNDIAFWFAFQSASGTSDPICQSSKPPRWIPDEYRIKSVQSYQQDELIAYSQWTPRTQRIPIGPLFSKATEVTIRASVPQLRRLRRFSVYRSPLHRSFIDANNLQILRLVVSTSTSSGRKGRQVAQSLKLAPFLKWANSERLAHRFSVQFV